MPIDTRQNLGPLPRLYVRQGLTQFLLKRDALKSGALLVEGHQVVINVADFEIGRCRQIVRQRGN
jgi:hypothetical protein